VRCAKESTGNRPAQEATAFSASRSTCRAAHTMLPDRRDFPCPVINMSPGGLVCWRPAIGNVGDRVIAIATQIGRVEGRITRIIETAFAM